MSRRSFHLPDSLPGAVAGLAAACLLCWEAPAPAASTIDATCRYAYGANLGWLDARVDTANGAVIGEYVCSGCLYAANVGWINLGDGAPTNGIQYQNLSSGDFGVNHDGLGNLRGYAYAANIGWISFEDTGAPQVDLFTGNLRGYAYSANCGWVSLSTTVACLRTTTLDPGPLSTNGLPIAWLLTHFGTTNVSASADPDHDGQSNLQEYLADTDPNDSNDYLRVVSFQCNVRIPGYNILTWTSKPTRFYTVQDSPAVGSNALWEDLVSFSVPGVGTAGFSDKNSLRFYRIRAYRPLQP